MSRRSASSARRRRDRSGAEDEDLGAATDVPQHALLAALQLEVGDSTARSAGTSSRRLGLAVLVGIRNVLRQRNLHDTNVAPTVSDTASAVRATAAHGPLHRRDATRPRRPEMGRAGSRFGRNVPLDKTWPSSDPGQEDPEPPPGEPRAAHPRPVPACHHGERARRRVAPVHDPRLVQPRARDASNAWTVKLEEGDDWRAADGHSEDAGRPYAAERRRRPPADVHQSRVSVVGRVLLYGTSPKVQKALRAGKDGKLKMRDDGLLDLPKDPKLDPAGPGLVAGRCADGDDLRPGAQRHLRPPPDEYPSWTDEEIFQRRASSTRR